MLLWVLLFVGSFGMLVCAVFIYQRAEDAGDKKLAAAFEVTRQNIMPKAQLEAALTDIQTLLSNNTVRQIGIEEKCEALVQQKAQEILDDLKKARTENELLKIRLRKVEKKTSVWVDTAKPPPLVRSKPASKKHPRSSR